MTSFYSSSELVRWRVPEAATIIAVSRLFQRRLGHFFLRETAPTGRCVIEPAEVGEKRAKQSQGRPFNLENHS
jgi:hypothetical protein